MYQIESLWIKINRRKAGFSRDLESKLFFYMSHSTRGVMGRKVSLSVRALNVTELIIVCRDKN